jgi:gluconate 2-dehydrogenase gamma chain
MPNEDLTRRTFVGAVSARLGAAWLAVHLADVEQAQEHARQATAARDSGRQAPRFRFFSREQARVVEAVTARIFPTDSTPGAREAGVVFFIDALLAGVEKESQPLYRDGLATLSRDVKAKHPQARDFAALSASEQDALLRERETTPFFESLIEHTEFGMFALPKYGGNRNYIGWKLLGQSLEMRHQPPHGYYDRPDVLRRLTSGDDE